MLLVCMALQYLARVFKASLWYNELTKQFRLCFARIFWAIAKDLVALSATNTGWVVVVIRSCALLITQCTHMTLIRRPKGREGDVGGGGREGERERKKLWERERHVHNVIAMRHQWKEAAGEDNGCVYCMVRGRQGCISSSLNRARWATGSADRS